MDVKEKSDFAYQQQKYGVTWRCGNVFQRLQPIHVILIQGKKRAVLSYDNMTNRRLYGMCTNPFPRKFRVYDGHVTGRKRKIHARRVARYRDFYHGGVSAYLDEMKADYYSGNLPF